MKFGEYPKLASFGSVAGFRADLDSLGLDMPCDDIVAAGSTSLFAAPIEVAGMKIGNRLALNPMEGWDGERDGRPSENTLRRWRRFGASGGKLVWGGEAVAVLRSGRARQSEPARDRGIDTILDCPLTRSLGRCASRSHRQ